MTKKDFINKINEEQIEIKNENFKVITSESGYIGDLVLFLLSIGLLCYFCVQGAIILVK